jgi:hypothetical protein
MTQNFVRYSPDVEHIEPDFDRNLQIILDQMKQSNARLAQNRRDWACGT